MQFLAGVFGIDLLSFATLSNHFHIILRIRPDVVAEWSDEDVARRWWRVFPARKSQDGSPAAPEDHDLHPFTSNPSQLAKIRERLASISGFMRCLVETVARRANQDDHIARFSRIFRRAAGTPASIQQDGQKRGRSRAPGIAHIRTLFA